MSGQAWQQSDGAPPADSSINVETGEGIPAWQFKIEGRLLEVRLERQLVMRSVLIKQQLPNQRSKDRASPRKFSTFLKQLVVEMDRDPAQYPDSNTVEVSCHHTSHRYHCHMML